MHVWHTQLDFIFLLNQWYNNIVLWHCIVPVAMAVDKFASFNCSTGSNICVVLLNFNFKIRTTESSTTNCYLYSIYFTVT